MGGTTGVAAKARAAPVASPATCPGPRRSSRFDVAIDLQNAFQDENSRVDKEGVLRAIAGSLLEPSAIGASGAGGQRALVAKSDGLFHILQDHVNSKFLGDQNAFFSALVNIADKVNSLGTPAVKKHKTDATHPLPQRAFAYVPTTQLQWAAAQRALTASSLRFALKPETNVKMLLEDLRHHIDDMERATKATKSEAARAAAAARVVEQQQHALLQSQQHRQAPLLHAGGVGAKRRRSSSSGSIVPAVTPSANEAAALWAEDDSGDVVQSARAQRRRRRLSVHDADTLLLQASAAFKRCSDLPSAPNEAAASSAAASGKNSGSSNMMLMTGAATGRRSSSRRVTRSSAPPPTPPVDADAVTAGFTPGESQQPLVHLPGKAAADDLTRSAKQQRVFGDDDNAMAAAAYTPADACTPSLGLFRRSASPFDDVELFAFCQQLRTTGEKHSRRWGGGGSMEDRAESIGCRLGKLPWEDSNDMGSGGGAGGGGGLWADLLASFNKAGDAPAAAGTAGDSGGAGTTGSGGDAVGGNASGVGGNANGAPSPAGPPAGASAGGSGGGGGGRSQQPGGSGGGDPPSAPPPPLDGSAAQASWVVPQAHVALNVGGAVYNTSSEVLTCVPRSFFFDLASMSPHHLATVPRVDGAYFIDRNPQVFGYVLDYLRSTFYAREAAVQAAVAAGGGGGGPGGKTTAITAHQAAAEFASRPLPADVLLSLSLRLPSTSHERHLLAAEARYYRLPGLMDLVYSAPLVSQPGTTCTLDHEFFDSGWVALPTASTAAAAEQQQQQQTKGTISGGGGGGSSSNNSRSAAEAKAALLAAVSASVESRARQGWTAEPVTPHVEYRPVGGGAGGNGGAAAAAGAAAEPAAGGNGGSEPKQQPQQQEVRFCYHVVFRRTVVLPASAAAAGSAGGAAAVAAAAGGGAGGSGGPPVAKAAAMAH